jgi:DNA-binding response OmpR family regulator
VPLTTVPDAAPTILLVDDEDSVRTVLAFPLERDGYTVVQAADGEEALRLFDAAQIDLVVLDIMLPKLDGLEVCKRLRMTSNVPIIMLTARDDELDKVLGLELGADDYITKPFSIREFRSRVKAALRRSSMGASASEDRDGASEPLHSGDLRIDFDKRTVRLREELVRTTFVEFEILGLLARSPGRVFSREALLDRIWGDSAYRDPRTIDVHIRHLREKLETDAKEPDYIFTVRGVGYRFRDSDGG